MKETSEKEEPKETEKYGGKNCQKEALIKRCKEQTIEIEEGKK